MCTTTLCLPSMPKVTLLTSSSLQERKVDIPPAVAESGGDPSGWATPSWTPQSAEAIIQKIGVSTAILSLTAPGVEVLSGDAQLKLARNVNEYSAALRDSNPSSFGFFAALPSLLNTKAALAEIAYALDVLKADGLTFFTRYGDGNCYLGHSQFKAIWEEVNRRKAVIFVHPTHPIDTNLVHETLPQPVLDYPHETTRAAMDMIMSGTKRAYPDCKVILSHAGGTMPYLLTRAAQLIPGLPPKFNVQLSMEEIQVDAKSFYVDLALSTSANILDTLLKHFPTDRILFGSDTPYAHDGAVIAFSRMLDEYPLSEEVRRKFAFENAQKLFPRLKGLEQ